MGWAWSRDGRGLTVAPPLFPAALATPPRAAGEVSVEGAGLQAQSGCGQVGGVTSLTPPLLLAGHAQPMTTPPAGSSPWARSYWRWGCWGRGLRCWGGSGVGLKWAWSGIGDRMWAGLKISPISRSFLIKIKVKKE